MITSALIGFLAYLMGFFIALLPEGDLIPNEIESAVAWIYQTAYGLNWLVPIGTLFAVFSIILVFELAIFTWTGVNWLIQRLRGG